MRIKRSLKNSSRNGDLFKQVFSYTALNVFEKLIPFFLIPYLSKVLTENGLGMYMIFRAVLPVLLPIISLNTYSAITLVFFRLDGTTFTRYLSSVAKMFFVFSLIAFLFFQVFDDIVSKSIGFSDSYFVIFLVIVFFEYFFIIYRELYRLKNRPIIYGLLTMSKTILVNGIGIALLAIKGLNWSNLLFGHLYGITIVGMFSIWKLILEGYLTNTFDRHFAKDSIKLGSPLALNGVGNFLSGTANRLVIGIALGAAATASFGVAAFFGGIMGVIEGGFNKAFTPYLFRTLSAISCESDEVKIEEIKRLNRLQLQIYILFILVAFSLILLGQFMFEMIFDVNKYSQSKRFIAPITLAFLLKGLSKYKVNFIFFTKQTRRLPKITLVTGMLNIILAFLGAKYFGLLGVAYSLLLTMLIQFLFTNYESKRAFSNESI
jgi:O-antigen/teichoic acid export membrane protein